MVDEVDASVGASEATRSESAHTPSAHAVGTTREVAFLERQHLTITIWPGNAYVGVGHQLVVLVELPEAGVVEVELCILCIGNAKERVLSFLVFVEVGCVGKKSEQVARCLHIGTQGMVAMAIGDAEANLHDEEVLVVIAQNGIAIAHAVEIVVLEGIADPRHVHIVQVEQIEAILQVAGRLIPAIAPGSREHTAMELRSVLHVVGQRELTGRGASTCKIARQERCHHSWEDELRLHSVFLVVLILVAFQAGDSLKGGSQLHTEYLAAAEEVSVLVGERRCCSEVASGIGALGLERNRRGFVHAETDVAIKKSGAIALRERVGSQGVTRHLGITDVRILHSLQAREIIVCLLQVGAVEELS